MKHRISALLLAFTLVVAPQSHALIQDWGGLENDWSMPTGTKYDGPTAVNCYAQKSQSQACRACAAQYDDRGQPTGLTVCAAVSRNAACSCRISGSSCTDIGTCSYNRY
jgi:hypothetical protein